MYRVRARSEKNRREEGIVAATKYRLGWKNETLIEEEEQWKRRTKKEDERRRRRRVIW